MASVPSSSAMRRRVASAALVSVRIVVWTSSVVPISSVAAHASTCCAARRSSSSMARSLPSTRRSRASSSASGVSCRTEGRRQSRRMVASTANGRWSTSTRPSRTDRRCMMMVRMSGTLCTSCLTDTLPSSVSWCSHLVKSSNPFCIPPELTLTMRWRNQRKRRSVMCSSNVVWVVSGVGDSGGMSSSSSRCFTTSVLGGLGGSSVVDDRRSLESRRSSCTCKPRNSSLTRVLRSDMLNIFSKFILASSMSSCLTAAPSPSSRPYNAHTTPLGLTRVAGVSWSRANSLASCLTKGAARCWRETVPWPWSEASSGSSGVTATE
mmetsp:Transcript_64166/g.139650  ORF Transcript_64166/g.139650 Transcript_64166/m.139650 type:complete len:322 (-) Transcript_64166:686-1651(-)